MAKILEESRGILEFSGNISEYILDDKMQLKAVRLKDGQVIDHESLHSRVKPKHPLISTPKNLKNALDQFFVREFVTRRTQAI
jgi:hypothetical protein